MGIIIHRAFVVTSWDTELLTKAHAKAKFLFDPASVANISAPLINHTASFAVFPGGSKEGWEGADQHQRQRDTFVGWLDSQRYSDKSNALAWVEVEYGEINYSRDGARVARHGYYKGKARIPVEAPVKSKPESKIRKRLKAQKKGK